MDARPAMKFDVATRDYNRGRAETSPGEGSNFPGLEVFPRVRREVPPAQPLSKSGSIRSAIGELDEQEEVGSRLAAIDLHIRRERSVFQPREPITRLDEHLLIASEALGVSIPLSRNRSMQTRPNLHREPARGGRRCTLRPRGGSSARRIRITRNTLRRVRRIRGGAFPCAGSEGKYQ